MTLWWQRRFTLGRYRYCLQLTYYIHQGIGVVYFPAINQAGLIFTMLALTVKWEMAARPQPEDLAPNEEETEISPSNEFDDEDYSDFKGHC